MELSGAAAACYIKCGRRRNGALMQADIVDALLARGDIARAAVVLHRQCKLFLREGWWHLAAAVLPRLLQCQKVLMQVRSSRCFTRQSPSLNYNNLHCVTADKLQTICLVYCNARECSRR